MAVPKGKTSKQKTRSRRASAWRLEAAPSSVCPQCGEVKLPHRVCANCGTYNGRAVLDV